MLTAATTLGAFGGQLARAEDSKTPKQIFTDARTATLGAKSLHYAGHVVSGGDTVSLDLTITPARSGGSITEQGATIQLVGTKTTIYLKASQASWTKLTGSAADGQLFANRWIKAPVTNTDFNSFSQLTNLRSLFGSLPSGKITKGGTSKINGQSAVVLNSTKGGNLYVADSGKPYILRLSEPKGQSDSSGEFDFDHYGSATAPSIPSGALDFTKLAGS